MFWDCHENLLKNKIRRQKRNKMVLKEQVVKKWSVSVERYYWEKKLASKSLFTYHICRMQPAGIYYPFPKHLKDKCLYVS